MGRKERKEDRFRIQEEMARLHAKRCGIRLSCPDCGFIPLVQRVKRKSGTFWVYTCKCSKAVIEAMPWEKTEQARVKYVDILYEIDGLRMNRAELGNEDIVSLYQLALQEMSR
jgi:hypothetical protein